MSHFIKVYTEQQGDFESLKCSTHENAIQYAYEFVILRLENSENEDGEAYGEITIVKTEFTTL